MGHDGKKPRGWRRRFRELFRLGPPEQLEARSLLAASPGEVAVFGATTLDSKGVTVSYEVGPGSLAAPLSFGVYRSATPSFGPGAVPLTVAPVAAAAVDPAGLSATASGDHALTIPLAGGLPPDPAKPYVVVVADPLAAGATDPGRSADFRTYEIGVIVHGGLQSPKADAAGPAWETAMAGTLRAEGYDFVIPYNWAAESSTPGQAARQIPKLATLIDQAATLFPAGSPVDLHVIGEGEGASIASQALLRLAPTPGLAAGYVDLTLLDPHPAGNGYKGTQYSSPGGLDAALVDAALVAYQAKANDPADYIPANVDRAEVYYQQTPAGVANGGNRGLLNVWGEVPVAAAAGVPVRYVNLTGPGISFAGNYTVHDWYEAHVVPLLGDGPVVVDPTAATATLSSTSRSAFAGTATPGAQVVLFAAAPGSGKPVTLGKATADAAGAWSVGTKHPLPPNASAFARVEVPAIPTRPNAPIFTSTTVRVVPSP